MAQKFVNNLTVKLIGDITTTQTTITVDTTSRFPLLQLGDWFYLTITDKREGVELRWEVVKVSSWTGTTLTCVRAQDGTTAQSWLSGSELSLRITAADMFDYEQLKDSKGQINGIAPLDPAGKVATNYLYDVVNSSTQTALDSKATIDDATTSTAKTWSSSKIDSTKQNTLVSGTNIKTINGESVLGAGDITTLTPTGTQTLTNKTISVDNNTVSGIAASSFVLSNSSGNIDGSSAQKAIPAGVVVGTTDTQTLTNKTISFSSNTLTDVASTNTTQTLTNKTLTTPVLSATGSGTTAGGLGYSSGVLSFGNGSAQKTVVSTDDSQTLTNKTLSNPLITAYRETVHNFTGTDINPASGTIQFKTLGANTTFTESLADGQSVTLMLNPATYTVTWPTITWIGSKASTAPTLVASVFNCITLFQFNGVLYGKYEGRV